MIPECLLYRLCGVPAREYTNATTMGLVNAQTHAFDTEILEKLGYPKRLFPKLSQPGTVLGTYKGISCMLCVLFLATRCTILLLPFVVRLRL